jgi:cellulose synthase (UDP-forming)
MQIMILKNPLFKRGLKPIQKIAYLSSMTFWLFPLPRMVFLLAPLLFILADIKVFVSNLDEAIAYTATYMVVNLMMQNYLYGSLRWPWISELYEYCQGVFLCKALVSVCLSPRKPTFTVTAKGLSLENDHLSELAWPFFAIYSLLLLGLGVSVWRYFNEPAVAELMVVVGLWNLFNLLLAGTALGAVAERKQADRHPRLGIARQGFLHVDGAACPVEIVDVSAGGCAMKPIGKPPFDLRAGETHGLLTIEPISGIVARNEALPIVLRHARASGESVVYGFEFEDLMSRDYYVLADLMYGDSEALPRFLLSRRKHKNVWAGTFEFLVWGVTEPVRAVAYSVREMRAAKAEPESAPPQPSTKWLRVLLAQARGGATKPSDGAGASNAA